MCKQGDIRVESVSKYYAKGEIGYKTLGSDISRMFSYLGLGGHIKHPRSNSEIADEVSKNYLALDNINLSINAGEIMGFIGENGCGKSTLLKIISRLTTPTSGRVLINGRVTSLLEVGTGFHPDLTGKENVFLAGAILGMKRSEIRRHLNEIIQFSGCENYIDTPVKRYSSGMYVRLGFAVAAHLRADILLLDEVLAVSDAEFQQQCVRKIKATVAQDGRTVIFVSHDLEMLRALCNKGTVFRNSRAQRFEDIDEAISTYLQHSSGIV